MTMWIKVEPNCIWRGKTCLPAVVCEGGATFELGITCQGLRAGMQGREDLAVFGGGLDGR